METSDLLKFAVQVLERLELRYFVTGSTGTIFYGEPRFTNDIDIVVALPPDRIRDLCAAFPADEFYVSEESAQRAVRTRGQFNIIHPASGLKIDIMVPADTAFNRSRFQRTHRVSPEEDFDAEFASAEDLIVKKLEYYQEGGSDKHLRDIAGVLRIGGSEIDLDYIAMWAEKLGLLEAWRAVRERLEQEQ